ncbi:MAG: glycosyltransferase family 2 protein [Flavobacteriaceae bacterium]|jgi:hypothetical protein|tara:strand:+ start:64 stop:813 length:750 start_codon:yes stop_codon:yes gene_type:complete
MKNFKNLIAYYLRFFAQDLKNPKKIPIFINNFNRLTTLVKLINALETRGYTNIIILDNKSTYPPLLEYYKSTKHKVHRYRKNYGYKSFWKSGLWLKYTFNYFVYTDPDVVPIEQCPENFISYFYHLLKKYPKVHKVGFSLKIDDLPDHYTNKNSVIKWEKTFYDNVLEPNVYQAPIDTTFALYRPFSKSGKRDGSTPMIRTGYPHQCAHLPWYINDNNLDEEEMYYVNNLKTETYWSKKIFDLKKSFSR